MANIIKDNNSSPNSSASLSSEIATNSVSSLVTSAFTATSSVTINNNKVNSTLLDSSSNQLNSGSPRTLTVPPNALYKYQWNLPPHQWSMPVEPVAMLGTVVSNQKARKVNIGVSDRYRRGRIYWYARPGNKYATSNARNTGSSKKDPRYGFQFMWNPESITTSVAVNLDITPTFADKFVDVAGAFPSGQALAVTIRLDRTNDFACLHSYTTKQSKVKFPSEDAAIRKFADKKYYDLAGTFDATGSYQADFITKLKDLKKLGTIADIEYLYKAINGPGWTNQATGRSSSDIGFLSPTLLRIDIGPLSYLGYVNNIAVNHIAFSRSMVPIRTDVSLQFNLMATAGLVTK
jgi:hypothetical protein